MCGARDSLAVWFLLIAVPQASGAAVPWRAADGGNGHFYEAVTVGQEINWYDANDAAIAAGGYLATITSEAENDFVFQLVDFPEFWNVGRGPWIGGLQPEGSPEPDGNWQWVTGEAFSYSRWKPGWELWPYSQPDDFGAYGEDRIAFNSDTRQCPRSPYWNDEYGLSPYGDDPIAYVVEFVPEPSTLLLLGMGAVVLLACAWRKHRRG